MKFRRAIERYRWEHLRCQMARVARWTLITVILLFAWIGFLHLTRETAVRHVRGVGADGVPVAVTEPQFPLSVTMRTRAWLPSGNRIEVALNGDGTYARLWSDLRSAQQSITLRLYYGGTSGIADTLHQSCWIVPPRECASSSSTMLLGRWTFRVAISPPCERPA
jgi:hypothetical protein